MDRRGFLRALGIGTVATALLPIEELIDRLAFARSPTTSIYVARRSLDDMVRDWEDSMFQEYARDSHFENFLTGTKWTPAEIAAISPMTQGMRVLYSPNRIH